MRLLMVFKNALDLDFLPAASVTSIDRPELCVGKNFARVNTDASYEADLCRDGKFVAADSNLPSRWPLVAGA